VRHSRGHFLYVLRRREAAERRRGEGGPIDGGGAPVLEEGEAEVAE
jgi:hypothetical protein